LFSTPAYRLRTIFQMAQGGKDSNTSLLASA
jgi:hypothetical protein